MPNVSIKINNKVGTCLQQGMIEIIREVEIDSLLCLQNLKAQRNAITHMRKMHLMFKSNIELTSFNISLSQFLFYHFNSLNY